MISERQNADELENLSALFDGELDGDAARFARKRLGHDAGWQQACGRWQLIGDALRGQATTAAPADFAHRVTSAVAAEPVPVMEPAAAPRPVPVERIRARHWVGGALAASMALVAVFVVRSPEPPAESGRTVAAVSTPPAPVFDPAPAVAPVTPPVIESGTPGIRQVAAAPVLAPARLPRSNAAEQAARDSTARIARAVQRQAAGLPPQDAPARTILADAAPDPFRPRAEIVTRPWPRAVLPNSQAAGALTASFEAPAPGSGSRPFYPFEPPSPAEAPASRSPAP
jgi:negative regulator of sigma E activity